MAPKPPSVDETASALTFPQHAHTNIYLHPGRVKNYFIGNIGAVETLVKSSEKTRGVGGELGWLFAKVDARADGLSGTAMDFNLAEPLAQALVLRAYLAERGTLKTDVRSAGQMAYVLARGPGGVAYPDSDGEWASSLGAQLPADVTAEVLAEHERRLGIRRTDDSHPEYWPSFARTPNGIAVALLGGNEMQHTNVTPWINLDVICCIFGTKVKDWDNWSLVTPIHAWFEPTTV